MPKVYVCKCITLFNLTIMKVCNTHLKSELNIYSNDVNPPETPAVSADFDRCH